jgi:hypothetical protein
MYVFAHTTPVDSGWENLGPVLLFRLTLIFRAFVVQVGPKILYLRMRSLPLRPG